MPCDKIIEVTIPKGWGYKIVKYRCGNTGLDGYPVLCPEHEKTFDRQEYRENCAANNENIDEDY